MELKKIKIDKNQKILKTSIFIFPLVFIFLIIINKLLFGPQNDFYFNFAKEDGPLEYLQVFFYFLSFIFSIVVAIKFLKIKKNSYALIFLILALIFFLITFEEISWGQRIFQIETPDYLNTNVQNEMNFHNLPVINDYKRFSMLMVSLTGFSLWAIFTHSEKLKTKLFTKFFVPETFLMSYFIIGMIYWEIDLFQIHKILKQLQIFLYDWPDNEVFEFVLSTGIFIFIFSKFIKINGKAKIKNLKS